MFNRYIVTMRSVVVTMYRFRHSTLQQNMTIKFGTSGWRGLIARDFTFDNVRLATQGIADYLNAERGTRNVELSRRKPIVILGYDTRFLGREFSLAAAEVLAANR